MSWYLSRPLNGTSSRPTLPAGLSTTTELGQLVETIRKSLPVELQGLIYRNVSGLFRFLAGASFTLNELDENAGPDRGVVINPVPHHSVKFLRATSTIILGEECLTNIGSDNASNYEQDIALQDKPVYGIQVSLGTYGVVALRVIYQDNTTSSWLGFGPRKWTATYKGDDLTKLRTASDGFKLISVGFTNGEVSQPPTNLAHLFFDHDKVLPPRAKYLLADMKIPGTQILGNPSARLAQYLDLSHIEIQSLTVVCNIEAIYKIQINGGGPKLELGDRVAIKPSARDEENFPVTRFFRPGERMTSIHLITRGPDRPMVWKGPFLLVRTSKSRTLYFGTFVLPFLQPLHVSSFEPEGIREILGLFIDPTNINPGKINTLGVCLGSSLPGLEQAGLRVPTYRRDAEPLMFPSVYPFAAFLSRTTLLNVITLKVQKFGDRCIGMCVERERGIIETLGMWDPVRLDTISSIYSHRQGPLQPLTFIYSAAPEPLKRYVEDIVVAASPDLAPGRPRFTWSSFGSQLAWWFTPRYTFIQDWQGEESDILQTVAPNIPCAYGR
ncbi:unnamed protein product [Clonostachys byssicola]|uniref:DUF7600 domain-containing protein n=1 Tax=Clonostachys byssicola TaxID=160290 RepID=A0A9N9UHW8_9HYPO|nr:unnamed protein product [Clonostachys byssicola]